jgi:hypothetical protein
VYPAGSRPTCGSPRGWKRADSDSQQAMAGLRFLTAHDGEAALAARSFREKGRRCFMMLE